MHLEPLLSPTKSCIGLSIWQLHSAACPAVVRSSMLLEASECELLMRKRELLMQAMQAKSVTSQFLVVGIALLALLLFTGCSARLALDPQIPELLAEGSPESLLVAQVQASALP